MVKEEKVKGYDKFKEFVNKLTNKEIVNIYFTGTKIATGESWCPDCVAAEGAVHKAKEKAPEDSIFLQVEVGTREEWKDMKNPFRTDKNTKLTVIPTLLRWKSPQRLEGEQCNKDDLLEMLFTDDDD